MDRTSLSREQAATLLASIRPMLRYLNRLQERMQKRGFPPHDTLYRLVLEARDRIRHLSVDLHYLSCDGGVGEPRRKR
jgi:N-methylhydantoinase A/oxoprolinase/acetone carboxylase beta subunit